MKTLFNLVFLLAFCWAPLIAQNQQQECIEDFEGQSPTPLATTVGNWQGIFGRVAFEVDASTNGTMILRGRDGSGSSWMSNIVDYSGNWLDNGICELCFDIRYVAGANNPATGINAINIFQNSAGNPGNANPQNAAISANFQVNTPIGSDWVRICVPIETAVGSSLPSNSTGTWVGPSVSDWNTLIQNISGISFRLDFGGGANPAENVYVDNLCFETCAAGNDCNLSDECQASNTVNFTTGVDASGNVVAPGSGVVDQHWRLINNPPLVGCTNSLQSTINGSAYLVNHNNSGVNGWVNQPGTTTLAPVDLGTTNNFGCNNLSVGNSAVVPYIFERLFCVCQDEEVEMDLTFRGDDTLRLELIDLISGAVIAASPGFRYPSATQSFSYSGTLPASSYALRAYLMNTNSTTLGFSVSGSMTNLSGRNTMLAEGSCCVSNPLVITKILDNNCDGEIDRGDEVGVGWQFTVTDASGFQVATGTTNNSGNLIINDLAPGTYTVTETAQHGWLPGTPSNGSMQVTVTDSLNQVYFLNCPQPCGEIIRDTIAYSCEDAQSIPYTFTFVNNSGMPVNAILINSATPLGTTITPDQFNLFFSPIPNGGTYGPVTVNINLLNPVTKPTNVCFTVKYLSDGKECCSYEHCVTILPPDPCEQTAVSAISFSDEREGCCYELELTNDFCPGYFTSIVTEVITPGVEFGSLSGGASWAGALSASKQIINWRPTGGGTIPTGTLGGIQFCLDNINNISQVPQEVVVHWMKGREIVCTDTLEFNCNPCAFMEVTEVICNDDGTVTFNYTIDNTSGQTVNWFYFQVQDTSVVFQPSIVNTAIPVNTSYSGSITITPANGGSLVPGTIIPFKLVLFGEDDWCCHMDGLMIEIPDCGKGCECGDQEKWLDQFNQGYSVNINCEEGTISFTTEMSECDSVFFNIYDLASAQLLASGSGSGDQVITLPILPSGGYLIEFIAKRYDANGRLCFEAEARYDIKIDCPPSDGCNCNDDTFFDAVNAGVDFVIDCEKGTITATTKMTACDKVVLHIFGPNNNEVLNVSIAGDEVYEFPILSNGTYRVEVEVYRIDENGDICMESVVLQELVVDCPKEGCCGSEDEFTAVIQAGYTVNFVCDGINGPVVTFTPNAATECDQIEWTIYDAAGTVLASSSSSGNTPVSLNVSEIGNFTLETRWERFNENGESCFGVVQRRQSIFNPCVQNTGPIVVTLAVKNNKEVTVVWKVDTEVSYDKYVILREDQQTGQVIGTKEAVVGQTSYQFVDETPEPGINKYVVYGLIRDQEAGRSRVESVSIQKRADIEVKIVPNPTIQYAAISMNQAGNYQMLIRDEYGRIHHQENMELQANELRQVDVTKYPAGILLIQMISETGETVTRRLVKLSN